MRYRTAAILSVVLIGGMFGLPAAIRAVLLPSLERGILAPVSGYEQVLLGIAVFCFRFRWVLALPIAAVVVVLFTIAALASAIGKRKQGGIDPNSPTVPGSSV
jgi:hypothetical protein